MNKITSPQNIAQSILKLSDYFINNPDAETPWENEWAQIAYLNYYHPLNRARLNKIFLEAERQNFFEGINAIYDFGAGLGAATLELLNVFANQNTTHVLIEKSKEAQYLAKNNFSSLQNKSWLTELRSIDIPKPEQTCVIFSYSMTELSNIPPWFFQVEAMIIVEPATHQDGRNLLKLRDKLIQNGYTLWAPCTHNLTCPLLAQSKTDWCHDRVDFKADSQFIEIEKLLPIKNKTLTMSYLMTRKKSKEFEKHSARITGDLLKEKGKDRQLVCRNSEREFLTWLSRNQIPHLFSRGDLIQISEHIEKKSNELRVKTKEDVSYL